MATVSRRQITKQYKSMVDTFTKTKGNKGWTNCFNCKTCLHTTKTINKDHGVTPYYINCEKCGNESYSSGFCDLKPEDQPTYEWYRPTLKQTIKLRKKNGTELGLVMGGMLFSRQLKVPEKPKEIDTPVQMKVV